MEQNKNMRPSPGKEAGTSNENWRSGVQETNKQNSNYSSEKNEESGEPTLTEQDLEENNLTVEEADQIEWEEPGQQGDTADASE